MADDLFTGTPIVDHIDFGHDSDRDSGYSSFDDVSMLTESVHSSIYNYRFEHGRRYHAFKAGENEYFMPNDDQEQFRQDVQHRCVFLATGSKLWHAPLQNPIRVLDLGTGTGIWALEVADKYPETDVHGVDLSPIQPEWAPSNVKFEIDDIEDEWTWPDNHFDLIYSKVMLVGSIKNRRKYFEQAFQHCAPDGYLELVEFNTDIRSDHMQISDDNAIGRWCSLLKDGIEILGSSLKVDFEEVANVLREIGFVDVTVQPFKSPIGTWPKNQVLKQSGAIQLVAMLEGVDNLSLAIFTRALGWSMEDTTKFLEDVKKEFTRRSACYYWPGAIIYARKPFPPGEEPIGHSS